ncbi:MAG: HAMP domain-containing protein, partial [Propionibacteriaceae bacterium]
MASPGPEFVDPADAQPPAVAPAPAPPRDALPATATPTGAGAEPGPLEPFGHGTLGRRLVVQVTVLVALVAVLLSTFTALAARTLLLGSIDSQLDGVSARALRGDPGGQRGPRDQLIIPGQPPGTLAAFVATGGSVSLGQIIASDGQVNSMPGTAVDAMGSVAGQQGKQTVFLPGLGRYRVLAREANLVNRTTADVTPGLAYWGVPLEAIDHQLAQLIGLEAVLTGLAIGGAVVASRSVVRRSLRPLNRVAATAQQVSQLPLDRGEVALAVRVPPEDADPTSEVGRVGQAFNHMLNNVEDALAARQASETKVRQFVADASHELR